MSALSNLRKDTKIQDCRPARNSIYRPLSDKSSEYFFRPVLSPTAWPARFLLGRKFPRPDQFHNFAPPPAVRPSDRRPDVSATKHPDICREKAKSAPVFPK